MSRGFICIHCGNSSLVRSNFRLTPQHEAECRAKEACEKRRQGPSLVEILALAIQNDKESK